jgi:hypothetical protein
MSFGSFEFVIVNNYPFIYSMTVRELYSSKTFTEAFGKSRVVEVVKQIRAVMPEFPMYQQPATEYITAWLLYILCNCKSTTRKDVAEAIKRGMELKRGDKSFVHWLAESLAQPDSIRHSVKSIFVFWDADSFVSVFTEVASFHKGANLIFQGPRPALKIRRSAIMDKDFLLEVAELIHPTVLAEEQKNIKDGLENPIEYDGPDEEL